MLLKESNLNYKKKIIILFVMIALVSIAAGRLYYNLTGDFRRGAIDGSYPFRAEWDIPELSGEERERLNKILDQEYTYLGRGAQSFAFLSDDGKYVIKLFKFKHLKPNFLLQNLPAIGFIAEKQKADLEKKKNKFNNLFSGYKLAYDRHKYESGLVYIHLNQSNHLHKELKLKDKLGLSHTLNLDEFIFVVQEKANTFREELRRHIEKGDLATAKLRINQIIDLYLSEYRKGFYDNDHGIDRNTGFVDGRPIHLDIGKLTVDETKKSDFKEDLLFVFRKINKWAIKRHPAYANEINQLLEDRQNEIFSAQKMGE